MARVFTMSAEDHARVSAAVHDAESGTAGEIVTIIADSSDRYADVALWWAIAAAVLGLAAFAAFPTFYGDLVARLTGGWGGALTVAEALELALAIVVVKFVGTRMILIWTRLLIWLTPKRVRRSRVHKRAVRYFKVGAESRTSGRTGILIYLSMAEHMAEIVADEAIHSKVAAEEWGEAMAHLVGEVRHGRVAEGMVAAIRDVGAILGGHLPRADDDLNELPDRLIEL